MHQKTSDRSASTAGRIQLWFPLGSVSQCLSVDASGVVWTSEGPTAVHQSTASWVGLIHMGRTGASPAEHAHWSLQLEFRCWWSRLEPDIPGESPRPCPNQSFEDQRWASLRCSSPEICGCMSKSAGLLWLYDPIGHVQGQSPPPYWRECMSPWAQGQLQHSPGSVAKSHPVRSMSWYLLHGPHLCMAVQGDRFARTPSRVEYSHSSANLLEVLRCHPILQEPHSRRPWQRVWLQMASPLQEPWSESTMTRMCQRPGHYEVHVLPKTMHQSTGRPRGQAEFLDLCRPLGSVPSESREPCCHTIRKVARC